MDLTVLIGVLRSERLTQAALPDGSGVLLDLDGHQVLTLNSTGMYLVDQLRADIGGIPEVVAKLTEAFEVDREAAQADVDEFVLKLAQFLELAV